MFDRAGSAIDTPTPSGYWENGWWEDTSPDGWEPNEIRSQAVPRDLEAISPGPTLATTLSCIDRTRVSGYDLVRVLKAHERLVSFYQAQVAQDMEELSRVDPDDGLTSRRSDVWDFASDEIRAALCLTRYSAETRLAFARRLVESFPQVLSALTGATIDWARARVIVEGVSNLDPTTATKIVDEVIVLAPELTTGQIRAWIRRLTIDVDPEIAKQRCETAVGERRVIFYPTDDGTVDLYATNLPADRATRISDRINQMLKGLERTDDRSHDQIRADIFLDLLDGDCGGNGGTGSVSIVVDLATLAGLNHMSAEIPGYGPVIADIARRIAATQLEATWNVTVTDQGKPVATGTTSRRPTNAMLRLINAIHPTCVYPGCRMPAQDCDIDHNIPWEEGGPTSVENSTPKCRHDHGLRHEGGWKYQLVDGEHHWTSPLGHTYVTTGQSP